MSTEGNPALPEEVAPPRPAAQPREYGPGCLVLARKFGERILIVIEGREVCSFEVVGHYDGKRDTIKLAFKAKADVVILREEISDASVARRT